MIYLFTKGTHCTLRSQIPTVREVQVTAHGDSGGKSFKSAISLIELAGWLAGWAAHETDVPCERFDVSSYHLSSSEEGKGNQAVAAERVRGGVRRRERRGRRGGVVLADQALEIAAPANAITRKNAEAPSLPSQQMITLGNQCRRPNISSRPPTLCSVLRVA